MKIGNYRIFEKIIIVATPKSRKVASRQLKESSKGVTFIDIKGQKYLDHPKDMGRYEELNRDSEVSTAISVLTNMTVGSGFYTEMQEDINPDHPNKKTVDDWAEQINLDEIIQQLERTRLAWGFCVTRKEDDKSIDILPSKTMYKKINPQTGDLEAWLQLGSNQEIIATWTGNDLDKITAFYRNESPDHPYGEALVESIVTNIDMRNQMNEDIPDVIHKHAYPFRTWRCDNTAIADTLYNAYTGKSPDEDLILENILSGQVELIAKETNDPRLNFTEYVVHNDQQIAEALHAPLLIYLRNATEASATKMLEAIDLDVQGNQRYLKRRIERYFFTMVVKDTVPRLIWGQPTTGLEEIGLSEIATLYNGGMGVISYSQAQDLIKKLGLPLSEPDPTQKPPMPEIPEIPQIPDELDIGLQTLENSFKIKKITLSEALKEANNTIESFIERQRDISLSNLRKSGINITTLSPESENFFRMQRNELFNQFRDKVIPNGAKPYTDPKRFEVKILDN